ncbi:hypothetical protein BXU10_04030 [Flavobacterium sp. LM4]|uniref:Uncharacterized protein n=1 Tax=Flavobacterium salmonis TaxID=2654844 RepID=A0A6V6YY85_9FLAO|nr:hypothetical protein BXU10_04030 [Flavobacterium sp. LM4]CAD0004443.1 hypothetical protein FLAT13_02270 [Flavobacterium salmonis]
MDIVGAFFLFLFILILTVSNILFIKSLKKNNIKIFKYKLMFFLMSIVSFFAAILIYYLFNKYVLIRLFKIQMINSTYKARFMAVLSIGIINSIGNFLISKFYLSKIYLKENTNKIEIELIGTE